MGDDMKRWYVVRHPQCPIAIDDFNARVWTLSLDPYLPGWNTPDIEGCGLPRRAGGRIGPRGEPRPHGGNARRGSGIAEMGSRD